MSYKARIYLRLAAAEIRYHYIGEIDLDRRPVEKGEIPFKRQGKTQLGSIEIVSPLDWEKARCNPHASRRPESARNARRKAPPTGKKAGLAEYLHGRSEQWCAPTAGVLGPSGRTGRVLSISLPRQPR